MTCPSTARLGRLTLALLPVAIGFAAPAAGQADSPYDQAVAARQAGDPQTAIALLAPWVAAHPDDVDARLQLAYTRLALDDIDGAETDFRRVLASAPDYADARDGLALIARRRARPGPAAGFVAIEGALSEVSSQVSDWRELALAAVIPVGRSTTLDLRGAHYRRFGVDDSEVEAGVTVAASPDTWLRAGASVTPNADFRPRRGVHAGIDHRVVDRRGATVIGLDLRHRAFPAQAVVSVEPHLTRHFADGRTSLTVRASGTFARDSGLVPGVLVRADHAPRERLRLFAGAAIGADTELGVVTRTRAAFAGAELPLARRVAMTLSGAREWRGDGINRSEGRIGLKLGF